MECTIFKLFVTGGRIAGALGYFRETGRFVLFRAGAIVLATGGIGKAWQITSNSWEYTGDGHALAYDAGAELIDMEFVQFHRSEEHTSELQSLAYLVCRLLLEKKKTLPLSVRL